MNPTPKIFIDAGHNYSSFNTGASANGLREQDITFKVAFALSKLLKPHFEVKLSRKTLETNLGTNNATAVNARWQMANAFGADLFISIHANAGGGTGCETIFKSDISKPIAQTINDTYAETMGLRNRGIKPRTDLAVLNNTKMPAILIELAFVDAPVDQPDVEILKNKVAEMAEALAKGIFKHYSIIQDADSSSKDKITLDQTINLSYKGSTKTIKATNKNGRFITTLGELAGAFPNIEIAIRPFFEAQGYTVSWEQETRTITIT